MSSSYSTWGKFIDWTDFSDPTSGFELVRNTVRMANQVDFFDDRDRFLAVVLTTASPMSSAEGGMGRGSALSAKYFFKARILGENSPHLFLPDPCALSSAGNADAAINAIHQHTTFFGITDYTGGMARVINAGDIVEVELEKGAFSYDLEKGAFIQLVRQASAADQTAAAGCANVSGIFGGLSPFAGGTGTGRGPHSSARGANDQTPEDICGLSPVNRMDATIGRSTSTINPVGVVLHYTAGGSTESSIITLGMRNLSYHFVVSRAGQITQLVRSNLLASHAPGYNSSHIGIGFVNLGYQEDKAGTYGSPSIDQWIGGERADGAPGRWEPYPSAQIAGAQRLLKALKCQYPSIADIKTHSEVNPGRKEDVGPAFPVSRFR